MPVGAATFRGLVSSGLWLVSLLAHVAVGAGSSDDMRRTAVVAATFVVFRGAMAAFRARRTFGSFGESLDLGVGLLLGLAAMAVTGGLHSELYVLILADLVLVRGYVGASAARFLTLATLAGLAFLEFGGAALSLRPSTPPLITTLRLVWPVVLIGAMDPGWWPRKSPENRTGQRDNARAKLRAPAQASPPVLVAQRHENGPAREAVDHFRRILHDLRSPVTVIRLYSDLISEAARKGQRLPEDSLNNLRAEIGLIETLLDPKTVGEVRRPSDKGPEKVNLVTLLGALANTYNLAHSDKLRIEFMADTAEIPVTGDPLALQRALRNVLDNAVKYTPAGGHVRIRAGSASGRAVVSIMDSGPGMSASEQRQALEGGFRGAAAAASGEKGMGVGLRVTRELLAANGGSVALISAPGRGSDVRIQLPLA